MNINKMPVHFVNLGSMPIPVFAKNVLIPFSVSWVAQWAREAPD